MGNCHKIGKIWTIIIIAIALILAILVSVLPQTALPNIIYATRFFDVMLPVLAFGALIKYLAKCGCSGCGSSCNNNTKSK